MKRLERRSLSLAHLFDFSQTPVLVSALTMGFLGSAHCVGMCGGIAALHGQSTQDTVGYQFGRILGYIILGAFWGALGDGAGELLSHSLVVEILFVSAFAGLFFLQSFRWWKGMPDRLVTWGPQVPGMEKLRRFFFDRGPLFTGLGTALLPCGWMASFGLLAASTQSAFWGAGVFVMLALGGLPALVLVAWGLGKTQNTFGRQPLFRGVMAALVLVSGFYSLSLHYDLRSSREQRSGSPLTPEVCHSISNVDEAKEYGLSTR